MDAEWTYISTELPRDGEPIEFLLDFRDVAIPGTYAGMAFYSRWAKYGLDNVRCWRNLTTTRDLEAFRSNQLAALHPGTRNHDTNEHPFIAGG